MLRVVNTYHEYPGYCESLSAIACKAFCTRFGCVPTDADKEDQRAHVPLFAGRHPDRRKAIFNQQLQHERSISSIVLLFPRFGRTDLRWMAHLAVANRIASNRWLRSPHESTSTINSRNHQ